VDVKKLIAFTHAMFPPQKRQRDFWRAGKKKKGCGENEFLPARPFKLENLYVVFLRAARPFSGARWVRQRALPPFNARWHGSGEIFQKFSGG